MDWSPDPAVVTDLPAPEDVGMEDLSKDEAASLKDVPVPGDDGQDVGDIPSTEDAKTPDAFLDEGGPGAEAQDPGHEEEGDPGDDAFVEQDDASSPSDESWLPDVAETFQDDTVLTDAPVDSGPCTSTACLQCRPCVGDTDCNPQGGKANRCIEQGPEGRFCLVPCKNPSDCPEGSVCIVGGGGSGICRPPGGCPCDESSGAYPTVCFSINEWGRCEADRICGEPCGAAIPEPESCNGADDDCDGLTDEELGTTTCGTGACARTTDNCIGGKPVVCQPATPGVETCNGLDDDCDGLTDEDLGATACGIGACATAVLNCVDGEPRTCEPFPPQPEICDGIDDDCDGATDEDLGSTTCGTGACMAKTDNCVAGKPATCHPLPPAPEVCNGLDDDCDGAIDEDLPALTCGLGICAVSVPACIAGIPQTCIPGKPGKETCNGLDDDCDGQTDSPDLCGCPVETWGGHVYLFCRNLFIWQTARDYCKNRGYHLVTLNSAEENAWLAQRALAWNAVWSYATAWWIGFSDSAVEGAFVWENGEPATFTAWHAGEPNDWGSGEDCASILQWGDATWNDAGCNKAYRYACER